ncbi:hypothetical protein BJ878DRAFT_517643 [Calycina marina]|uniref:MFS maltose permease n=1 Tax=Calycina marina TaxID=1763456 RepID=A0A9P8CCU6_9HELO|nr:hypothetical protein BJ878DRAFT_517643 [Calycina marina]
MPARLPLPILRIRSMHRLRPPNPPSRLFTQNTSSAHLQRPQLAFLSPSHKSSSRYLTTETKRWLKTEIKNGLKYTVYVYTFVGLTLVIIFGLQQEWCERKWPTPEEWTWVSRKDLRSVMWDMSRADDPKNLVDWANIGESFRWLLLRLENPKKDGKDLETTMEGGILVEGVGKTGYDINKKSEPWRRGYYTILMGAARAAEQLDGWVRDKTRNVAFPKEMIIGPSNPIPRPTPPGAKTAPKEEDCEQAFENPAVYYMRILTTRGFSAGQRVEAALTYANWLDYKETPRAAEEMYKWALDIALQDAPEGILDRKTGVLDVAKGLPSRNVLTSVTAMAVHYAANENLSTALPMLLSVLRARKSLHDAPVVLQALEEEKGPFKYVVDVLKPLFVPRPYPDALSDGTEVPLRTPTERCEEAGVMGYIGEILYVSKNSKSGQQEGLAWTREVVDIAEEELRRRRIGDEHKKKCKECMEVGLGNWSKMVKKLAKEEQAAKKNKPGKGWLSFGGVDQPVLKGRWETELQVVKERARRAEDVLEKSGCEVVGDIP